MVLIIKPVSAQLTKDSDFFGKGDPYCVIIVGQQKQRTKTHNGGGKKPQWYDTLQFQSRDSLMKVQVYDDDFGKDDFLGQGNVNLNQLFNNPMRTENQYVDLIHNGRSAGRVLISMQYQGPPMGGNNMGGNNQWGNQQGYGYGNQGGYQQPQNTGWGNQGGYQQPQNTGWGNQGGFNQPPPNNGWGNQGGFNQPPPNNGWGNQPNNGWGNNQPNNGWGNNNGW